MPDQLLNSHPEFGEAVSVTTAPGAYRCEPTGGEVLPLPLVLITSVLPEVIPIGERDTIIYQYIGKLISQGLDKGALTIKVKEDGLCLA